MNKYLSYIIIGVLLFLIINVHNTFSISGKDIGDPCDPSYNDCNIESGTCEGRCVCLNYKCELEDVPPELPPVCAVSLFQMLEEDDEINRMLISYLPRSRVWTKLSSINPGLTSNSIFRINDQGGMEVFEYVNESLKIETNQYVFVHNIVPQFDEMHGRRILIDQVFGNPTFLELPFFTSESLATLNMDDGLIQQNHNMDRFVLELNCIRKHDDNTAYIIDSSDGQHPYFLMKPLESMRRNHTNKEGDNRIISHLESQYYNPLCIYCMNEYRYPFQIGEVIGLNRKYLVRNSLLIDELIHETRIDPSNPTNDTTFTLQIYIDIKFLFDSFRYMYPYISSTQGIYSRLLDTALADPSFTVSYPFLLQQFNTFESQHVDMSIRIYQLIVLSSLYSNKVHNLLPWLQIFKILNRSRVEPESPDFLLK